MRAWRTASSHKKDRSDWLRIGAAARVIRQERIPELAANEAKERTSECPDTEGVKAKHVPQSILAHNAVVIWCQRITRYFGSRYLSSLFIIACHHYGDENFLQGLNP